MNAFEFHGYFRSGYGLNSVGGQEVAFQAGYLEATVIMAAVARETGVNVLVNMSQMTVSEMSIQNTTPSQQRRQHWSGEQALAWSGLPVVTIRPTMFLESFFQLVAVLADLTPHLGRIYELTGLRSEDMDGVAREFSQALNREITYVDISPEKSDEGLKIYKLPEPLMGHFGAMGEQHRAGRYDRQADGVQRLTCPPAMSVREFVSLNADEFGGRRH